jgi:alpha-L-rhamnosidase
VNHIFLSSSVVHIFSNFEKDMNQFSIKLRTSIVILCLSFFLAGPFRQSLAQTVEKNNAEYSISIPSHLLENRKPVASWIWDSGEENPRNYYLLVRKTVNLSEVPSAATAYISAYSFADVYINGKLVDRCPMNCDPEFQVYERYDLSGYFRKGKNTISALVYNFGTGMHHRMNGRGGFFFQASLKQGEDKTVKINSDNSWRVSKAEAWDNKTDGRAPSANLIGFIEKFDARLMADSWKESDFDDSRWEPARIIGIPPVSPWNNIVEITRRPLFREIVYPVNHWFVGDKVVYDFGKEIAGTPSLQLYSIMDGITLEMGTSERLLPDSSSLYKKRVNYTDFYISKKGDQSWSPVTWRGFRYLSLSQSDSVIVRGISAINRHYDFIREGSFECSDPLLNRIWETGNQTLFLCAQDTYMDTPWREQTQYIAGDSRYLQKYAYYPFGMSSELLIHYNILSGAWSQRWKDDGSIRSRYPTDWLLGEGTSAYLADYEFEWIIMLGEYYRYFGKDDLIKQVYPNLKKLLTYFDKYVGQEHGLLSKIPGWIVLDHPDTYPMDQREEITGLNCLYYEALKQASFIAQNIISDSSQAARWKKQADELRMNIRKWLWSPEKNLFIDSYGSKKYSQQTQVYALLYGLADDKEKRLIVDAIVSANRSSEESFSYYVLNSVFDEKPQWALDFIRKYWGGQMKSPLFNGAWHEAWDIASWTTDLGSTSHGWCSGPTALLPQKILGVEPISAGWKTFSVHPNTCDLKWAKGIIPSPFGSIIVDWKQEKEDTFRLFIIVPDNTSAEISLLQTDTDRIIINNSPSESCPGVKKVRTDNGRIIFRVLPGEYQIITTK